MQEIDGGQLEGGGQIIRTSCSLAALKQFDLSIHSIRKNRPNPGLAEQHVVCITSIADICCIPVDQVKVKQTTLVFEGSKGKNITENIVKTFKMQGAGSCCLVLQSLLPLCFGIPGNHQLTICGGTHALWAPTPEYYSEILSPALKNMGIGMNIQLKKYGFFPRGGGEMTCFIDSPKEILPITMIQRGNPKSIVARIICGNQLDISEYQKVIRDTLRKEIRINGEPVPIEFYHQSVPYCKTMIVELLIECEGGKLSSYCVQEKKESFSQLVERSINKLLEEYQHGGCCDEYLQDQLIIPMAFARGHSSISCGEISLHTQTMFVIIKQLLNVEFIVRKEGSMNIIETDGMK